MKQIFKVSFLVPSRDIVSLVGCLRETKKELFGTQDRLQKTEERLETLREKYRELLNNKKEQTP